MYQLHEARPWASRSPGTVRMCFMKFGKNKYHKTFQANKNHQIFQAYKYHQTLQANKYHQTFQANNYHQTLQANKYHQTQQANKYHQTLQAITNFSSNRINTTGHCTAASAPVWKSIRRKKSVGSRRVAHILPLACYRDYKTKAKTKTRQNPVSFRRGT